MQLHKLANKISEKLGFITAMLIFLTIFYYISAHTGFIFAAMPYWKFTTLIASGVIVYWLFKAVEAW